MRVLRLGKTLDDESFILVNEKKEFRQTFFDRILSIRSRQFFRVLVSGIR